MFYFSVLLLLAACLSPTYQENNKYCSISKEHTMCKYKGLGKNCKNPGSYGVSESDKKLIIKLHNNLRRKVAKGEEKRGSGGSQPSAANLRAFVWDNEIATVAQRWADQCIFNHDVRNVQRWKVGQNIYWMSQYPVGKANWTAAIYSWYDEVAIFNPNEVSRYRYDSATGHYTQMLWHSTYTVGCGRRDYGSNKIYVCNYGPSGNWQGLPIYTVGKACSKCPSDTVCQNHLCAPIQAKSDDKKLETREFIKEFESEDDIKDNPNAPKIYLALFYKGQVYIKPLTFLDSLFNNNYPKISSKDLIDERKIKNNTEEEIKILMEIQNKYQKFNETMIKQFLDFIAKKN